MLENKRYWNISNYFKSSGSYSTLSLVNLSPLNENSTLSKISPYL
jgi:hypothetical protein